MRMPHHTKTMKATIARPSVKFRSAAAGRTNGVELAVLAVWTMPTVPTPGSRPSQFATRIIRNRPMTSAT